MKLQAALAITDAAAAAAPRAAAAGGDGLVPTDTPAAPREPMEAEALICKALTDFPSTRIAELITGAL